MNQAQLTNIPQFWDTAGTERFRSISRTYYRGAAGAIIVYDISSWPSFVSLPKFLSDARAQASPHLAVVLAGNKTDLASSPYEDDHDEDNDNDDDDTGNERQQTDRDCRTDKENAPPTDEPDTATSLRDPFFMAGTGARPAPPHSHNHQTGRQVSLQTAADWARKNHIPAAVEVCAHTGAGVDALFVRIATMIVTKIEIGDVDPGDPDSGVQYGDSQTASWEIENADSTARSGLRNRRTGGRAGGGGTGSQSDTRLGRPRGTMADWGAVFGLDRGSRSRCC